MRLEAYRHVTGAWQAPVALACSGGVDSTALLVLASEARWRAKVAPFVVMHVDHHTRPDSGSDAAVVRALCSEFGVPFVALEVSEAPPCQGRSREDVWRQLRYSALAAACARIGVRTVVTAHTQDDQVETILMRMLSGSKLSGMRRETRLETPVGAITVLRPLIDVSRSNLDVVLSTASIVPLHDPSNVDTAYRRNALRHRVVPILRDGFPGFESALLRTSQLADMDAMYVDVRAANVYAGIRRVIPCGIALDRDAIRDADPAIGSRLVMRAALDVINGPDARELTHERVHAVLDAATGRTGATIELPYGVLARVERDEITFVVAGKGG